MENQTVRHKIKRNLTALQKIKYSIRTLKGNTRYPAALVANKLFPFNDPENNKSTKNIKAMINALMEKENAANKKYEAGIKFGKHLSAILNKLLERAIQNSVGQPTKKGAFLVGISKGMFNSPTNGYQVYISKLVADKLGNRSLSPLVQDVLKILLKKKKTRENGDELANKLFRLGRARVPHPGNGTVKTKEPTSEFVNGAIMGVIKHQKLVNKNAAIVLYKGVPRVVSKVPKGVATTGKSLYNAYGRCMQGPCSMLAQSAVKYIGPPLIKRASKYLTST